MLRHLHRKPDFLIIGAQKAGTTSLHEHLCAHPRVAGAPEKEVHYFDNQHARGAQWYLSRFPSRARLFLRGLRAGGRVACGESTPMYLFHPLAPQRIAELLPDARLIVLLRDPVQRAYSHYRHNRREGWEPLPFEEAIAREPERLQPALDSLRADPDRLDTRLHAFSYLARGRYLEQLLRYEALFPRERILILSSEEYFSDPQRVYAETLRFLGLPPFALPAPALNRGDGADLAPATRERLREYFRPHNEALFAHLGRRFAWD